MHATAVGLCPVLNDGTAAYAAAPAGTASVTGSCNAGYRQVDANTPPTRACNQDLSWGPASNACIRT
jgi:hypothetical protein